MSDRLKKQIAVELEQLRTLLEAHSSLLKKCEEEEPNIIELSALAAMLHSFYSGIENIFKRAAKEMDGGEPKGEAWHRQLLDAMAAASPKRPSIISPSLRETLKGYLDFRHLFRHSYVFNMQWAKMEELVRSCEDTLEKFGLELDEFMKKLS